MTTYAEEIAAARRLAILLALYFQPGYTLNRAALRHQVERTGYVTSVDLLSSECAWLNEIGLVEPLELDVVRLTTRGEDVALGRSQTPGVRRPSPGEINGAR
jgi:hypothetical protein